MADGNKFYGASDDTPPFAGNGNTSQNVSSGQPAPNPLEGKLIPEAPRPVNPLKSVWNAFRHSNFFKPVVLILGLGILLLFLGSFVLKNIGSTGITGDIVWWGTQHDASVYAPLIEEFEKQHPNLKVRYERQSTADYRERLESALASGKGPDIFEIHNSWPIVLKNYLAKMPSSIWSADDYKKSFYPIVSSNFAISEGIVGVPLEYDAITLFINEDLFAAGAKLPPTNWDELRDTSTGLTSRDSRGLIVQSGVALGITSNVDYWPDIVGLMNIQNHVNPLKPSGNFAQDVFAYYTMFDKRTWDNTLPPSGEAFAKGKLAMYFAPSREATNIIKQNSSLRFKTVRLPQLAKNSPTDPDFTYATYWAQAVGAKSTKTQAAWQFLKFMASEQSLAKLNSNIQKSETFGRVSPRPGMNEALREDNLLGSVVVLAGSASSSFLADKTYDGATGINSKLAKVYADTLAKWKGQGNPGYITTLAGNIGVVLSGFGITVR